MLLYLSLPRKIPRQWRVLSLRREPRSWTWQTYYLALAEVAELPSWTTSPLHPRRSDEDYLSDMSEAN